jgi:hypothetical protein
MPADGHPHDLTVVGALDVAVDGAPHRPTTTPRLRDILGGPAHPNPDTNGLARLGRRGGAQGVVRLATQIGLVHSADLQGRRARWRRARSCANASTHA